MGIVQDAKGGNRKVNIIVCVKQTPEAGRGELDRSGGTVKRSEERQVINPFDLYAMEAALRLQEEDPATRIIALSMGPRSAGSVLRDCIALGADTGYLVTDPSFAGSDVRACSHVLARAVRVIEKREGIHADAVFCGAKTIDGGTSMLGPELAVRLGYPQVTYALRCSFREGGLTVEKEDDSGNRIYSIGIPCLLTFTKASFPVRYPVISRILEAESMELPVLGADDLDQAPAASALPDADGSLSAASQGGPGMAAVPQSGPGAAEAPQSGPGTEGSGDLREYAGTRGAALCVCDVRTRKLDKKSQIIESPDAAQAVARLSQILYSDNIL